MNSLNYIFRDGSRISDGGKGVNCRLVFSSHAFTPLSFLPTPVTSLPPSLLFAATFPPTTGLGGAKHFLVIENHCPVIALLQTFSDNQITKFY